MSKTFKRSGRKLRLRGVRKDVIKVAILMTQSIKPLMQ